MIGYVDHLVYLGNRPFDGDLDAPFEGYAGETASLAAAAQAKVGSRPLDFRELGPSAVQSDPGVDLLCQHLGDAFAQAPADIQWGKVLHGGTGAVRVLDYEPARREVPDQIDDGSAQLVDAVGRDHYGEAIMVFDDVAGACVRGVAKREVVAVILARDPGHLGPQDQLPCIGLLGLERLHLAARSVCDLQERLTDLSTRNHSLGPLTVDPTSSCPRLDARSQTGYLLSKIVYRVTLSDHESGRGSAGCHEEAREAGVVATNAHLGPVIEPAPGPPRTCGGGNDLPR